MSKQTLTKLHRNWIGHVIHVYKNGRIEEKVETARRSEIILPKARHTEPCRRCGKEMQVADGQVAYFHGLCRSKVRSFKNQGKHE